MHAFMHSHQSFNQIRSPEKMKTQGHVREKTQGRISIWSKDSRSYLHYS